MNEWSIPLAALIVSLAALGGKLMSQRANGRPTEWQTEMKMSLRAMVTEMTAHTSVLHAIAARLEHLPTVGEMTKGFTDNRHDLRNTMTALMANVENGIKETRVDVGVSAAKIEDEVRELSKEIGTLQRGRP